MSIITLRPLDPSELDAVLEIAIAAYGDERAVAVDATLDDARRNARGQVEAAVPNGLVSPNQHFYAVMEGDTAVGHLWLGITEVDGFRSAFVQDLWLREDARGRGVGRTAMQLAEEVARELGARDMELHVFAHNTRARRLYESLGYRTTSVCMRRKLG